MPVVLLLILVMLIPYIPSAIIPIVLVLMFVGITLLITFVIVKKRDKCYMRCAETESTILQPTYIIHRLTDTDIEYLEQIKRLCDKGVLSEEEYLEMKGKILKDQVQGEEYVN